LIEIPEAVVLSRQMSERFSGKRISCVISGASPHKFAWFYGNQSSYTKITAGKTFNCARAIGGMVEGTAEDVRLLFSEGVNLRHFAPGARLPKKHQLVVLFSDGSALVASVQMYGGMGVYPAGENDNKYYLLSQQKPSPAESKFNKTYFRQLISASGTEKLTAKAFLATEQRIPGLGNGVLQDILFTAGINPKSRLGSLTDPERENLFLAVKEVLARMIDGGGRDTELDLDGNPGRYETIMSRKTVGKPCASCGHLIQKASYMGGSVYLCPQCQPIRA
jgi:formamidopyrimidine-DNA glycosylase